MSAGVTFAVGLCLPLAVIAHEATHAAVARLLGAVSVRAGVRWSWGGGPFVEHAWPAGTGLWRLYAANLAPLVVGVVVGLAVWLSGTLELLADQHWAVQAVALVAWIVYTRVGPTDLRVPTETVGVDEWPEYFEHL